MTNRMLASAVLIVLLCAGLAFGTLFTWTDLGGDTEWRTEDNWTVLPVCGGRICYPSTTSDDAIIAMDNVTVTLAVSETIDDLRRGGEACDAGVGRFRRGDAGSDSAARSVRPSGNANPSRGRQAKTGPGYERAEGAIALTDRTIPIIAARIGSGRCGTGFQPVFFTG